MQLEGSYHPSTYIDDVAENNPKNQKGLEANFYPTPLTESPYIFSESSGVKRFGTLFQLIQRSTCTLHDG